MDVTIHLPDNIAERLQTTGTDLSRRVLEALLVDEYRNGRLTGEELKQLLGVRTQMGLDEFLKAHGVLIDYTIADLEEERKGLRRLGF